MLTTLILWGYGAQMLMRELRRRHREKQSRESLGKRGKEEASWVVPPAGAALLQGVAQY